MASSLNVVIVGGGAAGLTIYKELPTKLLSKVPNANVILIEPRPFYIHLIGSLQMVVASEGNRSLMKYPASLNGENKRVIQGKVVSVTDSDERGHFVTLADGQQVEFSILVLATGGRWSGPLAFGDTAEEVYQLLDKWRSAFQTSHDVVLAGGGAVGFELAGEIKDSYPDTRVTIVHKQPLPLNGAYKDRWRRDVLSHAELRGINVVLSNAIEDLSPINGKVHTTSGCSIPADLVVPTFGSRPETEFIKTLGPNVLNTFGEVQVQPTLQLPNHPRIFASGDIIEWKEEKQAIKAAGHATVVSSNILALLSGQGSLKSYKSGKEIIVLTNGKNGGTTYIGFLWGIILGNWFTRLLKSKSLLIEMARKNIGLDK